MVTFTFSEAVAASPTPTSTVVGGTLRRWLTATAHHAGTATFTAADGFYRHRLGVGRPAAGSDADGNPGAGGSDTVAIDTLNPTVVSVTANDLVITDADVGTGTFSVAVTFSAAMDTAATRR